VRLLGRARKERKRGEGREAVGPAARGERKEEKEKKKGGPAQLGKEREKEMHFKCI
jgi:hypothetical protein